LKKEKIGLENQSKEHFDQIEKLTANYVNILTNNLICVIQDDLIFYLATNLMKTSIIFKMF